MYKTSYNLKTIKNNMLVFYEERNTLISEFYKNNKKYLEINKILYLNINEIIKSQYIDDITQTNIYDTIIIKKIKEIFIKNNLDVQFLDNFLNLRDKFIKFIGYIPEKTIYHHYLVWIYFNPIKLFEYIKNII